MAVVRNCFTTVHRDLLIFAELKTSYTQQLRLVGRRRTYGNNLATIIISELIDILMRWVFFLSLMCTGIRILSN